MKLNANEFLALDTIMNFTNDVGSKLDMVESAKNGEWEDGCGHCEACAEDIADRLGVSVRAAKGYIGSLAKKDLIICDEEDGMLLVTEKGILEWDKH